MYVYPFSLSWMQSLFKIFKQFHFIHVRIIFNVRISYDICCIKYQFLKYNASISKWKWGLPLYRIENMSSHCRSHCHNENSQTKLLSPWKFFIKDKFTLSIRIHISSYSGPHFHMATVYFSDHIRHLSMSLSPSFQTYCVNKIHNTKITLHKIHPMFTAQTQQHIHCFLLYRRLQYKYILCFCVHYVKTDGLTRHISFFFLC